MGQRKTNLDNSELLIHASVAGSLMVDKKGYVITAAELKSLAELEFKYEQFKMGNLPPRQRWTDKMEAEKARLIAKRDAPFELSDTAKRMIEEVWRLNEKGIPHLVSSKYMEKGLWMEEEGITLLTEVDGQFYKKNKERKFNDMFTGECDIICEIPGVGRVVQDVKCSWDATSFMNSDLSTLWEWQGRVYDELYDAEEFWLRCCLVDCPPHILEGEKYRFASRHGIIDMESPEHEELMAAFERTLVFSNNPLITKQERVKTFKIKRDKALYQKLRDRVPPAREYYKSIKLNQVI